MKNFNIFLNKIRDQERSREAKIILPKYLRKKNNEKHVILKLKK
jgi:hypothetical protein